MISKVYLIDDDEVCLMSLNYIFSESRYATECTNFKDTRLALDAIMHDLEEDNLPEIILLDLHIPEMSGWDFLKSLIPYEERLRNNCLIYVLTSSVNEAELLRAQTCGMVYELVQKPFTADILDKCMLDIVFMKTKYA